MYGEDLECKLENFILLVSYKPLDGLNLFHLLGIRFVMWYRA